MGSRILLVLSLIAAARIDCVAPGQGIGRVTAGRSGGSAEADLSGFAALLDSARLVDLTHPFDDNTIYWPTEKGFRLLRGPAGVTERGYFYAANRFEAAEHGGTHIDAPFHFSQPGQTVEHIPLNRLVGEAAVIDVQDQCDQDRDYEVSVEDLRRWETDHQRTLANCIVLIRTGYGRYWPDRQRYLGTTKSGPEGVAELHFPGLSPVAAQWLVDHRAVKCVGIDTASIDRGQSRYFKSHVTLFEHNVPALENVANLDQLPTTGAVVIALPMKIAGGTGAPLRIIAIVPPTEESSSQTK